MDHTHQEIATTNEWEKEKRVRVRSCVPVSPSPPSAEMCFCVSVCFLRGLTFDFDARESHGERERQAAEKDSEN